MISLLMFALLTGINRSLVYSARLENNGNKMEHFDAIESKILDFQDAVFPPPILSNWTDDLKNTLIAFLNIGMKQIIGTVEKLNITKECKHDINVSLLIFKDFTSGRNLSEWQYSYLENALLPMIDASAKLPPVGILRGHLIVFGQYNECMLVRQKLQNSERVVTGSYVRIFVDDKLRDYETKDACQINEYSAGNPAFDVCLPSSCNHYETLITLARSVIQINGSTPVCTVKQASVRLRTVDYKTGIVIAILLVVGMIALLATAYDLFTIYFDFQQWTPASFEKVRWFRCLMAFSIIQNTKVVFDTNGAYKPGQIGPIHFMRFISMVWVVVGHGASAFILASSNVLDIRETFKQLEMQFLVNAFFSVDTFFFMSGVLVSFIWFKEYHKNAKRQMSYTAWLMFYMHRIIRLSPPYYITILFYTFVFKTFFVNMPIMLITYEDYCEENWWINFFYLNNFIGYDKMCYIVSWYLATDFQMYLFSPILLIPLALKPLWGYIMAGLLILLSTIANLVTMYKEYFPPTNSVSNVMDPRMGPISRYWLEIYYAPWIRCQVYIIGILVGYLFQTKKSLHIPKLLNVACWIISVALGLLVVMSLRDWTGYDILMSLSERAFYSALSKLAWGVALAYITISCFYGHGGPINDFMSLPIWIPLGRLTYCTYLVHLLVVMYLMCMRIDSFTFSNVAYTLITFALPSCIFSWFFAYWLSILFEIPASKVEMIFLAEARGKTPERQQEQEIHRAKQQEHPVIMDYQQDDSYQYPVIREIKSQ